jgi:hypothetical protein
MKYRIPLTDEMVQRAVTEAGWTQSGSATHNMRRVLLAALGDAAERRVTPRRLDDRSRTSEG